MAEISATPQVGQTFADVSVRFISPGDKKTSKQGNKYTQAMALTTIRNDIGEEESVTIKVVQFEHVDDWANGAVKVLKLKEGEGRDGIRNFTVDDGGRGGKRGGGGHWRPTWNMGSRDAAKFWAALWLNELEQMATTRPDISIDKLAEVAGMAACELYRSANVAIEKPAAKPVDSAGGGS